MEEKFYKKLFTWSYSCTMNISICILKLKYFNEKVEKRISIWSRCTKLKVLVCKWDHECFPFFLLHIYNCFYCCSCKKKWAICEDASYQIHGKVCAYVREAFKYKQTKIAREEGKITYSSLLLPPQWSTVFLACFFRLFFHEQASARGFFSLSAILFSIQPFFFCPTSDRISPSK